MDLESLYGIKDVFDSFCGKLEVEVGKQLLQQKEKKEAEDKAKAVAHLSLEQLQQLLAQINK